MKWTAIIICLCLFAAAMIAEGFWLVRKGWTSGRRSFVFVLITNLFSLGISIIVWFVLAMYMMLLVFGSLGGGPAPGSEPAMWIIIVLAVLLPSMNFFLVKRLFLTIFKIKDGRSAWKYSFVSAFVNLATVVIPPVVYFSLA